MGEMNSQRLVGSLDQFEPDDASCASSAGAHNTDRVAATADMALNDLGYGIAIVSPISPR
jgi:hypothetical protein